MLEIRGDWIHVNISGQSRGWIRKAQVEFPEDAAAAKGTGSEAIAKSAELFRGDPGRDGYLPWNLGTVARQERAVVYGRAGASRRRSKLRLGKNVILQEDSLSGPGKNNPLRRFDGRGGGDILIPPMAVRLPPRWHRLNNGARGKFPRQLFWKCVLAHPPQTFFVTGKEAIRDFLVVWIFHKCGSAGQIGISAHIE